MSFSERKEIIERDNSWVKVVQNRQKQVRSGFIANSQRRIIILPLFRHA